MLEWRLLTSCLILLWSALMPVGAGARIVDESGLVRPNSTPLWVDFIAPSETAPDELAVELKGAPAGLYLGVGAERVFLGASQVPAINGILAVDNKPGPIRFVNRNASLLRAANADLKTYRWLRLESDASDWNTLLTGESAARVLDDFKWWQHSVREERHFAPLDLPYKDQAAFRRHIYLRGGEEFVRLSKLAEADAVQGVQLDLGDTAAIHRLVSTLQAEGVTLSVLDMSNTWQAKYVKEIGSSMASGFAYYLEHFAPVLRDDSIIVLSHQLPSMGGHSGLSSLKWVYVAGRVSEVKGLIEKGERNAFAERLLRYDRSVLDWISSASKRPTVAPSPELQRENVPSLMERISNFRLRAVFSFCDRLLRARASD